MADPLYRIPIKDKGTIIAYLAVFAGAPSQPYEIRYIDAEAVPAGEKDEDGNGSRPKKAGGQYISKTGLTQPQEESAKQALAANIASPTDANKAQNFLIDLARVNGWKNKEDAARVLLAGTQPNDALRAAYEKDGFNFPQADTKNAPPVKWNPDAPLVTNIDTSDIATSTVASEKISALLQASKDGGAIDQVTRGRDLGKGKRDTLDGKAVATDSFASGHREQVMELQSLLRLAGFDAGNVDGVFGTGTRQGLVDFLQAANKKHLYREFLNSHKGMGLPEEGNLLKSEGANLVPGLNSFQAEAFVLWAIQHDASLRQTVCANLAKVGRKVQAEQEATTAKPNRSREATPESYQENVDDDVISAFVFRRLYRGDRFSYVLDPKAGKFDVDLAEGWHAGISSFITECINKYGGIIFTGNWLAPPAQQVRPEPTDVESPRPGNRGNGAAQPPAAPVQAATPEVLKGKGWILSQPRFHREHIIDNLDPQKLNQADIGNYRAIYDESLKAKGGNPPPQTENGVVLHIDENTGRPMLLSMIDGNLTVYDITKKRNDDLGLENVRISYRSQQHFRVAFNKALGSLDKDYDADAGILIDSEVHDTDFTKATMNWRVATDAEGNFAVSFMGKQTMRKQPGLVELAQNQARQGLGGGAVIRGRANTIAKVFNLGDLPNPTDLVTAPGAARPAPAVTPTEDFTVAVGKAMTFYDVAESSGGPVRTSDSKTGDTIVTAQELFEKEREKNPRITLKDFEDLVTKFNTSGSKLASSGGIGLEGSEMTALLQSNGTGLTDGEKKALDVVKVTATRLMALKP